MGMNGGGFLRGNEMRTRMSRAGHRGSRGWDRFEEPRRRLCGAGLSWMAGGLLQDRLGRGRRHASVGRGGPLRACVAEAAIRRAGGRQAL